MWFNANPSSDWEVHVNPTDGNGKETAFLSTNENIENLSLSGVSIVQNGISYGSIVTGGVSLPQETSMSNVGNIPIDILISGTDMCTDSPTCDGNKILASQQKWHHSTGDFKWSDASTAPGPYTLVNTVSGADDEMGCLNRDIPVRTVHDLDTANESVWWKLVIPTTQGVGDYSGVNTFSSAVYTTCTDAQSY